MNIVNAQDLTEWFKGLTWGDTVVAIRYADTKNRDFVAANSDAVAKMMTHAYIKRHMTYYLNDFVGTDALQPVKDTENLSECVRAAIADGYPAYQFDASRLPPKFLRLVGNLNKFLHNAAIKHIDSKTRSNEGEFAIDLQFLNKEFADYRNAMSQAKWLANAPMRDGKKNDEFSMNAVLNAKSKDLGL